MNKSIIVALLILNVTISSANFLNKSKAKKDTPQFSVLDQLKSVESSDFGKKILDTITLQMKNKSPLADISRMLAEIRQDLVLQEHEADMMHNMQEHECDTEITEFARRIDVAQVERDDAESEIMLLKGEINNLNADISNKAKMLEIIDNREISLKADREEDAFNFAAREAQTSEVIGALDMILEKIGGLTPDASNEMILAQLSKIGASNPILAFAQVASGFSAESLDKVTGVLTDLKDSLEETMDRDRNDEDQAIQDYESLLGEILTTRKNIANAKAEAETSLMQNEAALALQENILEEAVNELSSAQKGKASKEAICADWTATWERNKEVRLNELNLIGQVANIIATKLDTATEYLIQRPN